MVESVAAYSTILFQFRTVASCCSSSFSSVVFLLFSFSPVLSLSFSRALFSYSFFLLFFSSLFSPFSYSLMLFLLFFFFFLLFLFSLVFLLFLLLVLPPSLMLPIFLALYKPLAAFTGRNTKKFNFVNLCRSARQLCEKKQFSNCNRNLVTVISAGFRCKPMLRHEILCCDLRL